MGIRSCNFSFLFLLVVMLAATQTCHATPFIFLHGVNDSCSSEATTKFTKFLIKASGVRGQCLEIGNGRLDSIFTPLVNQIQIACDKLKKLKYLQDGYNIVASSQGTLIGRGVVEFCDGTPHVKNFISIAGPHAGVAAIPYCKEIFGQENCDKLNDWVYNETVQNHFAPASFYKLPTKIPEYLANSTFLPKLNNERPEARNDTYKQRLSSLEKLVLIMNKNDTILIPKETSWFGYYRDGSFDEVLPPQQTKLYIEDWIGLKSLNETGKVDFIEVPGSHAEITDSIALEYVVPYLKDELDEYVVPYLKDELDKFIALKQSA